ncbi:MAG: flagellar biosynthesis protein FlhA [Planctomycetota bacterium]|nr:flagellar biosynthesis protein FlhA [Planctomycetota bacterium]
MNKAAASPGPVPALAAPGGGGDLRALTKFADVGLAMGVVGVIVVLVIPVPTTILDLLLCCQLALSLAVLMGTLYCNEPLEMAGFPALLLFLTLLRLGLNVASSRLILLQADAGHVIQAFGDFVVGGNYVVGFAIFLVLIVIQFVVITKGAGRVAEVAARFTLDAMPGKQMAIDADLNAGVIDETQARERRRKIEREANFFGSMDGASKFVRGDAVAALIIAAINVMGGLAIGVMQHNMELGEALKRYTLLTIGDGLVTQIPALLISTAAGVLVTRGSSDLNLGQDLSRQLLLKHRPIMISAVFLMLCALVPGLPTIPFLVLGGLLFFVAQVVRKRTAEDAAAEAAAQAQSQGQAGARDKKKEVAESLAKMESLELELGASLISLVDGGGRHDVLARIAQIRSRMAADLGTIVPAVRICDNLQLLPRRYRLRVRGAPVAEGELHPDRLLAINPGNAREGLQGTATKDPAFGLPAVWIAADQRSRAEAFGYTVVEAPSVLTTHLQEVLRAHAADLLSRQDVQAMVDRVKETDPAVVKDVVPNLIGLPVLHRVLQGLLRERVPVRDLITILETLGDLAGTQRSVEALVEHVRVSLAPAFVRTLEDAQGKLATVAFDPALESRLLQSVVQTDRGPQLVLTPFQVPKLLKAVEDRHAEHSKRRRNVALICSAAIRPHLRRLLERSLPKVAVLSYLEIPRGTQLEILAQIGADALGDDAGGIFGARPQKEGVKA